MALNELITEYTDRFRLLLLYEIAWILKIRRAQL